jgi:xanthine dehydrogenase D subunit
MTDLQAPPSVRGGPAGGRVGDSPVRPDGVPKVQGSFAFSSDLYADGMLWGRTLRSPHPHARIASIDVGPALAIAGVACVVTADDVPGAATYGLISADQPVFGRDVVRFVGEPVAAVAADHPDTARRALEAVAVTYEPLPPLVDADAAAGAPPIHPEGNVIRRIEMVHGDSGATGDVVVEGTYEVGMQDQAFLGPESGLAVPDGEGGIDLWVATQWLHEDRDQVAACLGLSPDQVRLHLGGVGGAFGGREDVSMQVHACLLALASGRPVKMSYLRDESFLGHVHRHPARMRYRHHATRAGDLVKVEATIVLDGGAYASSSAAVIANAARFACGPYRVPNAHIEATVVRTNNPPCGAMRGFGAVQACFGHESQMDRLAARLGIDPVELRLRNALGTGDVLPTGQVITGTAPVAECIRAAVAHPLPPPAGDELLERPGGAGRTDDPARTRRGVGVAVGFKNLMYSEGFDDTSEARVRLEGGVATVACAVAEVGQGFVTIAGQIARTALGCGTVVVEPAGTPSVGSAGSSSASRQTWMSGGAVLRACRLVADQVRADLAGRLGLAAEALVVGDDGRITEAGAGGGEGGDGRVPVDLGVAEAAGDRRYEASAVHRHRPTVPLDERGQGEADVSFVFAAHRAVVDVDPDLGLVRVVQVATGQDVGRVLHPTQVTGQIEGGIAQGVGLAVMEEIVVDGGLVRNPSFTDYLIPTVADAPEVLATCIEQPEPGAPFGAKGVGEPPTISSTAAVVAAIRDATGVDVTRVPVRPWDLASP